MRRTWQGILSAGLATLCTQAGVSAAPTARDSGSCAKSSQQASALVKAGHLRRAREAFLECAKSSCGGQTSQQCRRGLQQLDTDTPSIIPVVTDHGGAQTVDVRVTMDGELLASRIDGRSVDIDPGMHEFSFSTELGEVHSEQVLILEGQRNRIISVELRGAEVPPASIADGQAQAPAPSALPAAGESTKASSEPVEQLAPAPGQLPAPGQPTAPASTRADSSRGSPALAYIVGGAGLAAVGSSFLLAHWGREDSILLDRCAPNCSRQSLDHVSTMYIAADVTLGVGVVALGAATWLYLSRPEMEDMKSSQAYHFDVKPIASGAFATVGRAF